MPSPASARTSLTKEPLQVNREQLRAARLAALGLAERLPAGHEVDAIRGFGVRVSGPGGAVTALHARVHDVEPGVLDELISRRALVELDTLRGSRPVAVDDLPIWTTGALPRGNESLRAAFRSPRRTAATGLDPSHALDLAVAAARDALDGRALTTAELSAAITDRLPGGLSAWCRGCSSTHVDNGLFRLAGAAGAWCRLPDAPVVRHVRIEEWLERLPPALDADAARDAFVLSLLHAFGPLTPAELASWAGWTQDDACTTIDRLADQLVPVTVAGRDAAWAPAEDLAALRSPVPAVGVRLVPPYDELLRTPDRATMAPDPEVQKLLWRPTGNPGVVLADGVLVATWRATRKGKALAVSLTALPEWPTRGSRRLLAAIEVEATAVAALRGATRADIAFPGG